jgi:hypothetical protein
MHQQKKFLIVVPTGYSGGILVVRNLGFLLQKKGYQVSVFSCKQKFLISPRDRFSLTLAHIKNLLKKKLKFLLKKCLFRKENHNPLFDLKEKIFPFVAKDTIVIYPEIVYGNPLHAKKIVRWFLFHNHYPNDPNAYGKNELAFAYRDIFNDLTYNPTCRLLTINYFDSNLYRQTNFGERYGVCYIIRKGKNRKDLPKVFDGPIIDSLSEKEKVAVFSRCKYCYDYDTQTFYASIASVCGCIPIVVMEPGKTKSDYLGKGDVDWGRAYGSSPEEIEHAISTRQKLIDSLDFQKRNERNVGYFLQEIQNFFENNY